MSGTAELRLRLGPEEQAFRLRIGELRRLEEDCDAGPLEILARLADGRWRVADVRQPILHGLIGAGLAAERAGLLVERWVDERPLSLSVNVAYAVLARAVVPPEEEEDLGEREAGGAATKPPSREGSFAGDA